MFTLTGKVVSVRNLTKRKSDEVYAQEIQIMAGSDNYKYLYGVKDLELNRKYSEGDQITIAVNVKIYTPDNGASRLDLLCFKDQSVISTMLKDSKAA